MSDGDREDGGSVLPFVPRVVLPRSFDAPEPDAEEDGLAAEEPAAVSTWPRLPEVAEMRPPLHLTVPGVPKVEPASADEDEAGVFSPPAPEDPDAPTVGETLAVAVALLTALGVAAARAVWQRAQERQARAERARGGAGKASGGGDGAGSGGGRTTKGGGRSGSKGSSGPSLLRSPSGTSPKKPGGTSPKKKPSGSSGGPTGRGGGNKPRGGGNGKGGPSKAPKAGRDGRRKDGADKGDIGKRVRRGVEKLKRRGADKTTPDSRPDSKKPTGSRGRKLTWRAPKHRPRPGDDKAITARKRWSGRTRPDGKTASSSKRRGWRSAFMWVKRWRSRRGSGDAPSAPSDPTASATEAPEAPEAETSTPKNSPPPPPGFGGMRPPPGADRRTWVTVERIYPPPPPPPRRSPEALAGAPAAGRPALPAGTAGALAEDAPPPPPPPAPQEGPPVSTLRTTQYRDADLTIYDVIDADADMAEEIGDGSAEARATADGCERLLTKLEALHAEIVALGVPGVLEGLLVLLMDKTLSVKAKAEAIAAGLPAAAEAISVAGANAESRHRPLADVTRDMGHVRPAEREYHDE